jgi:glycosyltransferase involved in cell wall biosynthesis
MLSFERGTEPLVSIIIPTFKRPDTLERTVNSVLNQSYSNLEVIVVDDNNPDSEGRALTETKLAQFENEPRVKYIKHPYNKNGSAARNTGAKEASGDYLAFLDDDDEFLADKIASQVKRLQELPEEYAVCYSKFYLKKEYNKPFLSSENREGDLYFDALTRKFSFAAGSNMLIKKTCFESINGFDEKFTRNQDKEIVTRLLMKYKIAYSPVVGLIVHLHSNYSYFNPIDITDQYLEKFKAEISDLPADMRKTFDKIVLEDRFFYHLRSNHEYKQCLRMIIKNEISPLTTLRIIFSHALEFIKNRFF